MIRDQGSNPEKHKTSTKQESPAARDIPGERSPRRGRLLFPDEDRGKRVYRTRLADNGNIYRALRWIRLGRCWFESMSLMVISLMDMLERWAS
jgi:hypothetical protein